MVVHHCRGGEELSLLGLYKAVDFIGCILLDGSKVFEGHSEMLNYLNGKECLVVIYIFKKLQICHLIFAGLSMGGSQSQANITVPTSALSL